MNRALSFCRSRAAALTGLLFYALASAPAYATATTGMPWEGPLTQILDSIQGPVARIIAVIIIAVTGLTLAFGDTSGGFRRLIQVVFGISIAFAATSLVTDFFGFGAGATVNGGGISA